VCLPTPSVHIPLVVALFPSESVQDAACDVGVPGLPVYELVPNPVVLTINDSATIATPTISAIFVMLNFCLAILPPIILS